MSVVLAAWMELASALTNHINVSEITLMAGFVKQWFALPLHIVCTGERGVTPKMWCLGIGIKLPTRSAAVAPPQGREKQTFRTRRPHDYEATNIVAYWLF